MKRIRATWSPQEMGDVIDFLTLYLGMHEPAQLRLKHLPPRELLVAQMTATICTRMLLQLRKVALQPKPRYSIGFPPEYAQALACAWLEPSITHDHAFGPFTSSAIGNIHQQLQ